jgi:FkbM family methyltransferase
MRALSRSAFMKLAELFYAIGIKPRIRQYPFELRTFHLERDGDVGFAQWQHPGALRWKTSLTQAMVDEARRYVRAGDSVIDVGAHAGDSTLPLALAAGPAGAVFALEPNPYVFKVLLATTALNKRKTNIYPLMFAATAEDGAFEFEYADSGFCNGGLHEGVGAMKHAHFFRLPVQGRNLARYLDAEFPAEVARLRFIKVDAEGYDRTVVASLMPLVARSRPYIKSEIYRHSPESERRQFWRELRDAGYRVHRYDSDEHYQGDVLSEDDMVRWSHFDIFAAAE